WRLALGQGSMLSSVEDGSAVGNARCVERFRRILSWSVRPLESTRLMVVTSALAGGRRIRIARSGRVAVGTDALAGGSRTLTPASGRPMSDSSGLTGRRWKRAAARRNAPGEARIAPVRAGPIAR